MLISIVSPEFSSSIVSPEFSAIIPTISEFEMYRLSRAESNGSQGKT